MQGYVAFAVRALRMQNRHVGIQCRDRGELFAGERTSHSANTWIGLRKIIADVTAQGAEGQPRRAGAIGGGHAGMAVLVQFQRLRPLLLDGIAQTMQRADARIAAPGEGELSRAAHADQLVVDQVGR